MQYIKNKTKLVTLVLTHIRKDKTIALTEDLITSINNQTIKSEDHDFILTIHNKFNYDVQECIHNSGLDISIFKDVISAVVPSYHDMRNHNLDYVIDSDYTHYSFIDGDDSIDKKYTEYLLELVDKCDDFIVFGCTWYTKDEHYFQHPLDCCQMTNATYLWNIDFVRNNKIPYFSADEWADDVMRFIKLTQFYHKSFKFFNRSLYKYNKADSVMSNNNEFVSNEVTEYFNYYPKVKFITI